jgi:Ca2+-transporting ATPase
LIAVTDSEKHEAPIWHALDGPAAARALGTSTDTGLSADTVAERLAEFGPNELIEQGSKGIWRILVEQLSATLVLVLIAAGVVSAALKDFQDALAIMAIVALNAIIGLRQEYRAERAMAALQKLAVPTVKVRRAGHIAQFSARDLVPGDLVILEAGDFVPADGRLLESANLRVQEAALTGESEPVEKNARATCADNAPLAERLNMVYSGTAATYGRGTMVVTQTGMRTELGKIASMLQSVKHESTPLQVRLNHVGQTLAIVALVIVAVIFAFGLMRGEDLKLMFLTSVSLAVAAVPEGLPAVVTIALALGAQRMLNRNALIRKLPAVETLGSVTIICSDKTGTLTKNRMAVAVIDVAGRTFDLSTDMLDDVQSPDVLQKYAGQLAQEPSLELVLAGGALCSDAQLEFDEEDRDGRHFHTVGDPTEGALVSAATSLGILKTDLEQSLPRVLELPFDSDRKRMTTVHERRYHSAIQNSPPAAENTSGVLTRLAQSTEGSTRYLSFTKGAVDSLLVSSTHVWIEDRIEPITDSWRERIRAGHDRLANHGMRVLGVAMKEWKTDVASIDRDRLEQDLTFVGLIGMIDPPRAEVPPAVATCLAAGIRPIMITGDHPLTARYIANELGFDPRGRVVTGQDLDRMSPEQLDESTINASVYARVSPEHKLRLVESLQRQGHVVAMTGDGVNDAPALKKADIGVAMGITGTDVAKEAADMVLRDDNFATIVAAVEQGRIIFDNIRKFIRYLLSANVGEILVMLLGPIVGMPMPLWPLQILWMNLVTDGFPALALAVEPAERNTMQRPPYPPRQSIFARGVGVDIAWIGTLMGLVALAVGYIYWKNDSPHWQTIVFTTLTLSQMTLALASRSESDSLFQIGLFTNPSLLAAVTLTLILQAAVIYVPLLQGVFQTAALSRRDLLICLGASTIIFWAVELKKLVARLMSK